MLQHGQNHAVTSCCEHGSSLRDAQALSDDARANLNDGSEAESLHVGASSRQCGATNKLARPTTTFRRTLLAPWTRTWRSLLPIPGGRKILHCLSKSSTERSWQRTLSRESGGSTWTRILEKRGHLDLLKGLIGHRS